MRQIIDRNIHAALICPNPKDGTSLYRGHGPFGRLARTEPSLHLHTGTPEAGGGVKWSWTDFVGVDIAILQRPAAPPHVAVAQMAKDAGIPLWVDFDDDVTVVPISNRYHASFPKAQTEQCISQLVEMADVVTVTTEALAQRFKGKSRIIPNALDDFAVGFSEKRRNRVIAWRGSNTHDADLDTVMSSLSYHCANADWRWWFYGDPGWRLAKAMTSERVRIGPAWTDWRTMMSNLEDVAPYLWIVPLEDNTFNRAKSNCAWLEATAVGAAVLAPALPEWDRPGIETYRNEKEFDYKLRRMMSTFDGTLHPNVALSREYIRSNLLLSEVNQKRAELLVELTSKNPLKSKIKP